MATRIASLGGFSEDGQHDGVSGESRIHHVGAGQEICWLGALSTQDSGTCAGTISPHVEDADFEHIAANPPWRRCCLRGPDLEIRKNIPAPLRCR